MSDDPEKVIADFKEAVNMTTHQLEAWLEKEESKKVGYKAGSPPDAILPSSTTMPIRRAVTVLAMDAEFVQPPGL